MYDYTAYGLTIRSAILLPELVEASALELASTPRPKGEPLVHITLVATAGRPSVATAPASDVWATRDSAFVDYPATAAFLVTAGQEISITPTPNADPRLIRLFLLGPILALLL